MHKSLWDTCPEGEKKGGKYSGRNNLVESLAQKLRRGEVRCSMRRVGRKSTEYLVSFRECKSTFVGGAFHVFSHPTFCEVVTMRLGKPGQLLKFVRQRSSRAWI